MSAYRFSLDGEQGLLEIGGNWNDEFYDSTNDDEKAQVIAPIWNTVQDFVMNLNRVTAHLGKKEDSRKIHVGPETLEVSWVMTELARGVLIKFGNGEIFQVMKVSRMPTSIIATSMRTMVWFLDHRRDVLEGLLPETEHPVVPDEPRYLIRVCRGMKPVASKDVKLSVRRVDSCLI